MQWNFYKHIYKMRKYFVLDTRKCWLKPYLYYWMKWSPQMEALLCKIFLSDTTFPCQHILTSVSGCHLPRKILPLEMEQVSSVWNSAHLPGCLQSLLNIAWVLPSTFPNELSSVFLTDGGCMTCCQNKINPIPCKTSLSVFIFPCGKKRINFTN